MPEAELVLVEGGSLVSLAPEDICSLRVGQKAFGLASIPAVWTPPFFVVSGAFEPDSNSIEEAFSRLGFASGTAVIVRSSGVDESIDSRGSLDSQECDKTEVLSVIQELKERIVGSLAEQQSASTVHWVVQLAINNKLKGHLSNERRLSEALRDWVVEVEATEYSSPEIHKISIRKWRDSRQVEIKPLNFDLRSSYLNGLRDVAHWAHSKSTRVHFEWVWDGRKVYVVQADECNTIAQGVDPTKLFSAACPFRLETGLQAFREADDADYNTYSKLANARIYREIGYKATSFYVLNDGGVVEEVLGGACGDALTQDLRELTKSPLVIRTDGLNIPSDQRQMLPRSNELRSLEAAQSWLTGEFRDAIIALGLSDAGICLIAHHFIPASAAAWSQAHPDKRRVRIESLWGLPEGLYWYAHDVFDVDTQYSAVAKGGKVPADLSIRERRRFKGRFVAPDEGGNWIVHSTAAGFDWNRSIKKKKWIEEIAWSSRKIATAAGKPVVVMWFVDVPRSIMPHTVLPWYHEDWKHEGLLPKAAPRKKLAASEEVVLRTKADWHSLKNRNGGGRHIERVLIDPTEPDLVRDQEFARDLAKLAQQKGFVVELSGGVLSHAFYMLTSSGCNVECVDLYATDEGELEFNKLVRDNVPDSIHARGEEVKLIKLEGEAFISALKQKVVEEALEVFDAKTSIDIIEELADLRETAAALATALGVTDRDVEEVRREKLKKRGGFKSALMLEKTALASSLSRMEVSSEDPFYLSQPHISKTISLPEELPYHSGEIHSDRRHDSEGNFERQFTISMPAHFQNVAPSALGFFLESSTGGSQEYVLELQLDRKGGDMKCKIKIKSAPAQMVLDF